MKKDDSLKALEIWECVRKPLLKAQLQIPNRFSKTFCLTWFTTNILSLHEKFLLVIL